MFRFGWIRSVNVEKVIVVCTASTSALSHFASCFSCRTACGCCLCLPLLLDVERLQGEQQFEVEKSVFLNGALACRHDFLRLLTRSARQKGSSRQLVLTLLLPKSDADRALLKPELLRRA